MPQDQRVLPNLYRDSVALMQISARLAAAPGVDQAYLVMATPANLEMLAASGFSIAPTDAGPNDLLIVVQGATAPPLQDALHLAEDLLQRATKMDDDSTAARAQPVRSIQMGLEVQPGATLALISTPGEYAAAEAFKALRLGLNVMIFSDNVALEDEIALKRFAAASDLLVMGPDCGTAILGGIPLAFANVVQLGQIGVIGASGTGIQQITCLVDRLGAGISHALGTGGRDLHSAVGGITMQAALAALAADHRTEVVVLVSKPPAPEVAARVLEAAARVGKPVVVNFLGAPSSAPRPPLYFADTLADAARTAVALAQGHALPDGKLLDAGQAEHIVAIPAKFSAAQRYVRGLYSGGTFCYEALLLLEQAVGPIYSNLAKDPARRLGPGAPSREHAVLDLGDDEFTRGRPHPMIDQRLRCARILAEAADPGVAVLVLDVVLGYGAHDDPAAELGPAIAQARVTAAAAGRHLAVVAFVCGTSGDPQQLARQEQALTGAGAILAESSTAAVRLALALLAAQQEAHA